MVPACVSLLNKKVKFNLKTSKNPLCSGQQLVGSALHSEAGTAELSPSCHNCGPHQLLLHTSEGAGESRVPKPGGEAAKTNLLPLAACQSPGASMPLAERHMVGKFAVCPDWSWR